MSPAPVRSLNVGTYRFGCFWFQARSPTQKQNPFEGVEACLCFTRLSIWRDSNTNFDTFPRGSCWHGCPYSMVHLPTRWLKERSGWLLQRETIWIHGAHSVKYRFGCLKFGGLPKGKNPKFMVGVQIPMLTSVHTGFVGTVVLLNGSQKHEEKKGWGGTNTCSMSIYRDLDPTSCPSNLPLQG